MMNATAIMGVTRHVGIVYSVRHSIIVVKKDTGLSPFFD